MWKFCFVLCKNHLNVYDGGAEYAKQHISSVLELVLGYVEVELSILSRYLSS